MEYKYCPRCRAEYRPGFDVCSDCGVALVDQLPTDPITEVPEPIRLGPDAAEVWKGFHEVEAHMARSLLESNGIDAVVWTAGVGANVPFDDTIAHRVMVKAEDADRARGLIAALPTA